MKKHSSFSLSMPSHHNSCDRWPLNREVWLFLYNPIICLHPLLCSSLKSKIWYCFSRWKMHLFVSKHGVGPLEGCCLSDLTHSITWVCPIVPQIFSGPMNETTQLIVQYQPTSSLVSQLLLSPFNSTLPEFRIPLFCYGFCKLFPPRIC